MRQWLGCLRNVPPLMDFDRCCGRDIMFSYFDKFFDLFLESYDDENIR